MTVYAVTCAWHEPDRASGLPGERKLETVVVEERSGDHAYRKAFELRPDLPLDSRPDVRATVQITPVTTLALASQGQDQLQEGSR